MTDMLQKAPFEITTERERESSSLTFHKIFCMSHFICTAEEDDGILSVSHFLNLNEFKPSERFFFFYSNFLSPRTNSCKNKQRYGMDDESMFG